MNKVRRSRVPTEGRRLVREFGFLQELGDRDRALSIAGQDNRARADSTPAVSDGESLGLLIPASELLSLLTVLMLKVV